MGVFANEPRAHGILVDLDYDGAGLLVLVHPTVVEDRYDAVGVAAGVVLVVGASSQTHVEVAPLPAKPPGDLARLAVDLVDGGSPTGRDEQVFVIIYVYRVDVRVVEIRLEIRWWFEIRLLKGHVLQAVPLKEHLAGLDIDLLDYPVEHSAVRRTSYGGQIPRHLTVDRDQRRVLGRDEELVVVALVAVAGPDPLYLPIRVVHEHVLALAKPRVESLPPGEHLLDLVFLPLEIERVLRFITLQRLEPYRLPAVVDDQRCVFAGGARPGFFLRGDEDVTGGRTASLRPYLDDWRPELQTRTEGPRLLPPCRRSDSPGARAPLTAQGASQRDPSAPGSHSLKESSSRDLRAQSFALPYLSRSPVAHHTEGLDISCNRGYPASVCVVH